MKVTVTPEGEVSFDTEDSAQALEMIRGLRNGGPTGPKKKRGPYKKKSEPVQEVPLSAPLVETWNWLVANASDGVTAQEVADALDLKQPTASYRLGQLIDKDLAHSPKRGVYLPGEASE